jgi:RNA polymerase sigma factor (sigma-70 family)
MDERTPDLIERLRSGDQGSYAVLYQRYLHPLKAFIRAHAGPALLGVAEADDLAQSVQVEALRSIDRFEYQRELSFYFWLCGIARNLIRERYRRLRQRPPTIQLPLGPGASSSGDLLAAVAGSAASPLEQACLSENLHVLALALEGLDPRRKRAIVLSYFEGRKSEDAAALMAMKPGAFRVLLFRALEELRGAFGEDPPDAGGGSRP